MIKQSNNQVIGVLALQGDFAEHINMLDALCIESREVRTPKDLEQCDALILPGGESTVMWKLMQECALDESIKKFVQSGKSVLGTCAGAILLSDSHLQLMDITVERNAYGSQAQSFSAELEIGGSSVPVQFIRAPRITRTGSDVEILSSERENPVYVRQGNCIATTFHTETVDSPLIHKELLKRCVSNISVQ